MTKDSFIKQVEKFHKELGKIGLIPKNLWIDKREKRWVAKFFICFDTKEFETEDICLRNRRRIYASITIRGGKKLEYYGDILFPIAKRFLNPPVSDLLKELASYKPAIEDFKPEKFGEHSHRIYPKESCSKESYITSFIAFNMKFSVLEASEYAEALYMGDIAKSVGYLLKFKNYNSELDKEIKRLEGVRPSNDHDEARERVEDMMDYLVDFRCKLKLCLELDPVLSAELNNVKSELVEYLKKGAKALSEVGIEFPDALNLNVTPEFVCDRFFYCPDKKKSNDACDLVRAMEDVLERFHKYAFPIVEHSFFESVAYLRILHSCIDNVNSISKLLKPKPKSFDNAEFKSCVNNFKFDADDFGSSSFKENLGIASFVSETLNSAKSVLNKKGYRFTVKIQDRG